VTTIRELARTLRVSEEVVEVVVGQLVEIDGPDAAWNDPDNETDIRFDAATAIARELNENALCEFAGCGDPATVSRPSGIDWYALCDEHRIEDAKILCADDGDPSWFGILGADITRPKVTP